MFEPEIPQPIHYFRDNTRSELDKIALRLQDLQATDLTEVLLFLASSSARLGEIRLGLVRSSERWATGLRTKELDPMMELLRLQFQIYSRITAVRQQELDLLRGQT